MYEIGEIVLVRLPHLANHRRSEIIHYNKQTRKYIIKFVKGFGEYEVTARQIKPVKSKSPEQLTLTESQISTPKLERATSPSTRRRGRPARNSQSVREAAESTPVKLSQTSYDSSDLVSPDDVISEQVMLSRVSYYTLIYICYLAFGILGNYVIWRCIKNTPFSFGALLYHLNTLFPARLLYVFLTHAIIISSHFLLFTAFQRFRLSSVFFDFLLPLIIGFGIYSISVFDIYDFEDLREHYICSSLLYLGLSVILLKIQFFFDNFGREYVYNKFLQQHSILVLIELVLFHVMSTSHFNENFSFYLLFVSAYIIAQLKAIPVNSEKRTNFLHLLFARPFLLTIPILKSVSNLRYRWPFYCYIPIFALFTVCFIKLIEPRRSAMSNSNNFVVDSLAKLCIASLAGFYWSSTLSWIAIFAELIMDVVL